MKSTRRTFGAPVFEAGAKVVVRPRPAVKEGTSGTVFEVVQGPPVYGVKDSNGVVLGLFFVSELATPEEVPEEVTGQQPAATASLQVRTITSAKGNGTGGHTNAEIKELEERLRKRGR